MGAYKKRIDALGDRCGSWLADPHNGEVLFLLGFILYMWRNVWVTTMFPLTGLMTIVCIPLTGILVALKILLFDRYSIKELFLVGGVAVCVLASAWHSRSANPFFWILIVIGSKDIPFRKLLKIYLAINGAIVLLAFCSSYLGVIEDLQYDQGARGVRNSFGIIFPTDFAAHIFFMTLVFFYLMGKRLKWYHHLLALAVAAVVFHFCKTRLDCICLVLMVLFFGVGNGIMGAKRIGWRGKEAWQRCWIWIGSASMVLIAALSIALTMLYPKSGGALEELNQLVSGRLKLGMDGVEKYGFKPFGQVVEFIGFGESTESVGNYSFVDCSYMYVLLRYGVVFLFVLLGMAVYCCYRNWRDLYFLYAMTLVAINCAIAHHILQIEYIPFFLALLARCGGESSSIKGGGPIKAEEGYLRWGSFTAYRD